MILVTGHKGILGRVLTSKLKEWRGFDLEDGCNINDPIKLVEALQGVDAVVHLAAVVGEDACLKNIQLAYDVNAIGTMNVVDWSLTRKVDKLVLASTCSVYGDRGELLLTEHSEVKPWGHYAKSKRLAENFALESDFKVLRFGSLYGGEGEGLPEAMKRDCLEGEVAVRDADSWRPLTHVEDAADAIVFALQSTARPQVLNVVGENIRKGDLAWLIADKFGGKVKLEYLKGRSYRVSSERLTGLGFKFKWTVGKWLNQ